MSITEPNNLKMINFYDLLKYARKYNYRVTRSFLMKNGFNFEEAKWLIFNKEEINMQNQKIQADMTNEKILELEKIINEQNLKIKRLITNNKNNNNKNDTKPSMKYEKITDNKWRVKISYKSSKNNKIKYNFFYVENDNVIAMRDILRFLLKRKGDMKIKYKDIVNLLLIRHKIDVKLEHFNGGFNRRAYMFPYYYYPLKILNHLGEIDYKNSSIIKVKNLDKR